MFEETYDLYTRAENQCFGSSTLNLTDVRECDGWVPGSMPSLPIHEESIASRSSDSSPIPDFISPTTVDR